MGTSEFDRNFFYYLESEDSLIETHQKAFAEYASLDYPKIVEQLPIKEGDIVVDLGGGLGVLLNLVINYHENIHGFVIDLPRTINLAKKHTANPKICFIEGDFFKPLNISFHCDVLLISRVLHDWEDSKAIEILTNAKSLLSPNGRICVVEHIRHFESGKDNVALLNLHMYCIQKGKERTLEEFKYLFEKAGLKMERVERMDFLSILIARS